MPFLINGKKYDPETSEKIYSEGQGDAACRRDGCLSIFRSLKGTIWAVLSYWPDAFGPQKRETAVSTEDVRRLCVSLGRIDALEALGQPPEEG